MSPHILIFPYPAQGHMLPLLDLTDKLSMCGLTITVLVTPANLPLLSPLLAARPSIRSLVFPFPEHPALPQGVENVRQIGNHGNVSIIAALSKLHDPIIEWFGSHPDPPIAILSDFFLGWTKKLADQLRIPRFVFFSSGAFLACVSDHCWVHLDDTRSSSGFVEFPDLPRKPILEEEHLPSVFRNYRRSDPDWEVIRNGMIANTSSSGCVFNSFASLEGEYLDHLKMKLGHSRVYGVGPLCLGSRLGLMNRGNPNPDAGSRVLKWLDNCPRDGSALYVCFGSQKLLKREQMEALASSLEKTPIRFVWVVNPTQSKDGQDFVPAGFEEEVGERGLVVRGWVPQMLILGHKAVGGFLSHCGWNSVLEAITAGVLILAWPMEADQFVNAKLLVDYMDVAVRVCEGTSAVPDSNELARTIVESMSGENIQKLRAGKLLMDKALATVDEDGSSSMDFGRLVDELRQSHKDQTYRDGRA